MKHVLQTMIIVGLLTGCNVANHLPKATTQGDPINAVSYGYQPIDPLPIGLFADTGYRQVVELSSSIKIPNKRIMASLPDETMRLAVGQIDGKGNISFATAKLGYAGSSYIVILDYVKFDTKSLPVLVLKDTADQIKDFKSDFEYNTKPDAIIPVYVGIGLRFTATIT